MVTESDLRKLLTAHLRLLERSEGSEFVDIDLARDLHQKLALVLDRWTQLTDAQRHSVTATVHYLVDTDDEEHDLHSPIGFVDDGEKVDALLRKIAPDLL